jgi:hypothetical protein
MRKDTIEFSAIETTNATPKVVPLLTVPPDSIINLSLYLNARTPAGAAAAFRTYGAIKRIGTGNAVLVGATTAPFVAKDAAINAITAALSLSGVHVMLTVTGIAGTTIKWTIAGESLASR